MHALMVVLIEAGAMASKLEIPMETMIEILAHPDGIMRPLEHRMRDRMGNADRAGGLSVTNARKDSMLALEMAQDLGVPLFATSAAHTPYEIAEQLGYGELDYAGLAELWDRGVTCSLGELADSTKRLISRCIGSYFYHGCLPARGNVMGVFSVGLCVRL